jgi:hypothetical protein
VKDRRLIEHLGGFARVLRYAASDLDPEQFQQFLRLVIDAIAETAAESLDEAWKTEES